MDDETTEVTEKDPRENGGNDSPKKSKTLFSRRNLYLAAASLGALVLIAAIATFVSYRIGLTDSYIKAQFVAKMNYIGIDFTADVFRVRVNPLELELKNATFNDRVSGEKLFFIRDARIGLTIQNLFSWQLSRDISVDSTEINGAEVWVKFDEDGRSNFANLVEDTRGSNLNFRYNSMKFVLRGGTVHFGDLSRKIGADANNVQISLEPESLEVPEDQIRYRVDLRSSGSTFIYDERELRDISILAIGFANSAGAEITDLRIDTPIGNSYLKGSISDWVNFTYNLSVESTVDLTQTSSIFPIGASLGGVGNFNGTVSGSGEKYKVIGVVESQAISAEGVYLKGLNIDGTVEGTNSNYEANGKAIAELLTFGDFRIDLPRLAGNVRGTGTDFRWIGELQAIAAKSGAISLGRLFLSDALAEYKDKELTASGNGRTERLTIADSEINSLSARNINVKAKDGSFELSAASGTAGSYSMNDLRFNDVSGRDLRVSDRGGRTEVKIGQIAADSGSIDEVRLRAIRASDFTLVALPTTTELLLRDVAAARADADGTVVEDIFAPAVQIRANGAETAIYSDTVRVAKIDSGSASMGSLNIAGVRLTIRQGRIQGTSNDIDAGNVTLARSATLPDGGTLEGVSIKQPIFVLEPSGRYRASADMSIGGGIIGSVPLGSATANVDVNNDRMALQNLEANVMDGRMNGTSEIGLRRGVTSTLNGQFEDLDLSKLIATQAGRLIPFEGRTNGRADLSFDGTDYSTTSGTITATVTASADDASGGSIPLNGDIALRAENGMFSVEQGELTTQRSTLNTTGRLDLRGTDSDLNVQVRSNDADEIYRIFRILGVSPDIEQQLDDLQVSVAGDLAFNARLEGNIADPVVAGDGSVASVSLRGREIGSLRSDIAFNTEGTRFTNGSLREPGDRTGQVDFDVNIPAGGINNISVNATLKGIDAGSLIAAIPVELPGRVRDFTGITSGTVDLSGLPDAAVGSVELRTQNGAIAGEPFDQFELAADLSGTRIDIKNAAIKAGNGDLAATGYYDRASSEFDLDVRGSSIPLQLAASLLPESSVIPTFGGEAELTAKATGFYDRPSSYSISFEGQARDVTLNETPFGVVDFRGTTENQVLRARLQALLEDRPQTINATLILSNDDLPFTVESTMDNSPLRPFFALIPQLRGISISGTGTGRIEFGGNLSRQLPNGEREFSTAGLSGSAVYQQISLLIQDTPLNSTEPVIVRLDSNQIVFEAARFAGGGSNVFIAGTKALSDDAVNDLTINGRINLALLNVIPSVAATDTFFGGIAELAVRLTGPNRTARLTGTGTTESASIAAFIGSDRLSFDRVKSRVLFSSNQAQIEFAEGFLGGGRFTANGGVLLTDRLQIDSYRVGLTGTNVTVPLPDDFITTGDARLELTGRRIGQSLLNRIAGSIIARRSLYTRDIDLANIVGGRRDASISGGGTGSIIPTLFDLTIEGRDALVIRNNIADLTASASLRLTGTSANPQISGRIVATEGTVFFRKDRYEVQRGVLEFPPNTSIDPIINLIAETEINGYQVFVNLSGPLTDTELLSATVRSSPALPQADVISLITTGSLANTESGIPTLASTGINTAAEVLTDAIISNPARRATDRLFGLNVFEIDPIISGDRINPTARLTVGRQINNNLRVTYATNLSQDQNQVLALEYRVSNRLSVVAQYEQRSLSNVTRNRDNFSFEVRFRKRF